MGPRLLSLRIRDRLNAGGGNNWSSDETNIPYDDPTNPFGNLQFGLLWRSAKVTVDPTADSLLTDLRQPRDANGNLQHRRLRIPWLVPVTAGGLSFDLLVLHLKSGGQTPQAAEVRALQGFIIQHQLTTPARHLIVCGDWNIRPDRSTGRFRLRRLEATVSGNPMMRLLTIEASGLTLDQWATLGTVPFGTPTANLIPFSHYNRNSIDTFLDHMATSRTLDEVFDNPIRVDLEGGGHDLRPGIRVITPLISEEDYLNLTDHLPVVLLLRVGTATTPPGDGGTTPPVGGLDIVAALPNPDTNDADDEEVHLRNTGTQPVPLTGWKIGDSTGTRFWVLNDADRTVQPGDTVIVRRQRRNMALNNSGGDRIVLINPAGDTVDEESYGNAPSGRLFRFE